MTAITEKVRVCQLLGKDYEDWQVTNTLLELFKKKRNTTLILPPQKSAVILIVSGGLDSVSLWYLLLKKYRYKVYPLHYLDYGSFNYGQYKAVKYYERLFAKLFPHQTYPVKFNFTRRGDYFSHRVGFARQNLLLKDYSYILNNLNIKKSSSVTYGIRPLINPIRLTKYAFDAYRYALMIGHLEIKTIILGIVPSDVVLARESSLAYLKTVALQLCLLTGDFSWSFTAPIDKKEGFFYTKTDLIKFASQHSLDLSYTWSCSHSHWIKQCGSCLQCQQRQWAFKQAKAIDKTTYCNESKLYSLFCHIKKRLLYNIRWFHASKKPMSGKNSRFIFPDTKWQLEKEIIIQQQEKKIYLLNPNNGTIIVLENYFTSLIEIIKKKKFSFKDLQNFLVQKRQLKIDLLEKLMDLMQQAISEHFFVLYDEKG